jgi:lipopolysaccharide export LptBFGC system permease protein LptF
MGGIPWILWRHVAWEVFRTFVVTTSIIVTVIAFGAAAKPLADNSIGADTVLKYVSLAMVPMLQYAMPFAAGFAATLAMHRFATDNEVTAMSAVGMSTRMVLAPVFLLGLPLFAVMLALVMYLIPHFWLRMQELATADATQMLVASIERGQALKADRLMIYADSVREAEAPEGVRRRLHLEGVAAVELSPKGGSAVETEFTAEAATVDVHATSRGTVVKVVLLDATVFRPAEGALVTVPRAEPEAAAVYGTFDRGPKFLSIDEILRLRVDPDSADAVRRAREPLALRLGELELWSCLEPVASGGRIELAVPGSDRSVRIEGATCAGGRLVPAAAGGTFSLVESAGGRDIRSATATGGSFRAVSEAGYEPRLALSVPATVSATDVASGLPGRWTPQIDDLLPTGCAPRDWTAEPTRAVLDAAARWPERDGAGPYAAARGAVDSAAGFLQWQRDRISRDAESYVSNRLAQAVSIVLVLLLGATLAIAMRRALPLTVYILAFVPAIVNIMMIASGRQMIAGNSQVAGFLVLWGGNAVLAAALWLAWRRVARN